MTGGMSWAFSRNWALRPCETCQAMWQWNSHEPGLLVSKATSSQPNDGSMVASRRTGLSARSWLESIMSKGMNPLPPPMGFDGATDRPRMKKTKPKQAHTQKKKVQVEMVVKLINPQALSC